MPTAPRAVSSRARASSAPKRTPWSVLMTRAATFWPLKFPGSAAGFLQLETKDVEAHAAAATAAVTTRADLDRSKHLESSSWEPDRAGARPSSPNGTVKSKGLKR